VVKANADAAAPHDFLALHHFMPWTLVELRTV
jgi:hypothetical protein